MRLKLDRDVVFFDFEATGVDATRDRIVQIAMIRLSPAGSRRTYETLIDPEMPIPAESTAVHKITDAMVRGGPRFREEAPKVVEFLRDADLGGFGVARYDVPLLLAEFKRVGVSFEMSGRRVLDALTVYHRMEPRNLAAAHAFYCGKPLANAHNAMADAEASLNVFLAQVEKYQGSEERPNLPADVQGLHDFCGMSDPKNGDSRGKFVWRHGEAAFNFGRYQTRPLAEILRSDPGYLHWLAANSAPEVADICRKALAGELPKKTR